MPFDSHGARRVELSVKVRRHIRPDLAAPPVMKRHRVEHQSHRTYFDRSGREKDSRQKHNAGPLTGDLRSRAADHARRRYSAPSAWVNPWITPRVEPGRPCDALLFPERRLSPAARLLARSTTRGQLRDRAGHAALLRLRECTSYESARLLLTLRVGAPRGPARRVPTSDGLRERITPARPLLDFRDDAEPRPF